MIPEPARQWLEAALNEHERPLYDMAHLEKMLAEGVAHLHLGDRSAMVICITDEPSGERLADVWLAGGDLQEIKDAVPHLERWALAMGCTQAIVNGRQGWVRELAPFGFEYLTTSVRKLLQ